MAPPRTPSPRLLAHTSNRRAGWHTLLVLSASCLSASASVSNPARAQLVQEQLWGTDGTVTTIARSGSTVYVGGAFRMAGPVSGGGVTVSGSDGNTVAPLPRVAGVVQAVIPDGTGGWFIGGSFVSVGGQPRVNLAHILGNGDVSAWAPNTNGEVMALALDGQRLYGGGSFSYVAGQSRPNIAAVGVISGEAAEWNPDANQSVRSLLVHRGLVYVGGDFSMIGGAARNSLAALDPASGTATMWNPDVGFLGTPGSVRALAALDDTILVGGLFWYVGTSRREHLAAVGIATGLPTPWDPRLTGPDDLYFGDPFVNTLAVKGGTVYVGGHYTGIGGAPRSGLAQIGLATGIATSWNPDAVEVTCMAVRETTIFVGGHFLSVGGVRRRYLAEIRLDTGALTDWDPAPNDALKALAEQSGVLYAGGTFTGLGSEWRPRSNLAAFDATTGTLRQWDPNPDGLYVATLAATHGQIYVGGYFFLIGGQVRYGLASVDTVTGTATAWDPTANSVVGSFALAGDTMFVGGYFTSMGGQPRGRLASFNVTTGQLTDWNPNAASDVHCLLVKDGTVYVGGFFRSIGGVTRNRLAAVDAVTGAVQDWNPNADSWTNTFLLAGDTLFVGGRFHSIGGQLRESVAALDLASGTVLPWTADVNSEVSTFVTAGDTLFIGGSFSVIGGVSRQGLACVNASTGAVLPWDPQLNGDVLALAVSHQILYVGGGFHRSDGVPVSNLAAISLVEPPRPFPTPPGLMLASLWPNPVRKSATVRFALPLAGPVDLAVFDVQGRRVMSLLRRSEYTAGVHDLPIETGDWREGFYFLRLESGGHAVVRKFVVLE